VAARDDGLALLPDPAAIHERLCRLARERALLRRQLRLSLAARDERQRRGQGAAQYGRPPSEAR
jgi:hypothetical protein